MTPESGSLRSSTLALGEGMGGDADFRALFEAMPCVCAVLAPDAPRFTIVGATEAYCLVAQTTCDRLVGRSLFEAFPDAIPDPGPVPIAPGTAMPERRIESSLRESLAEVCRTRASHRMGVQRYDMPRDDGTLQPRYWQPVNIPVLALDGAVRYILHQVEDVTDRIEAEDFQREMTGHLATFNAQLSRSAEGLETRVAMRTAELAKANEALTAALAERERAERERNELLLQLGVAQEEERRRLSRDLHDEVGQHLTALGLGLQALSDVVPAGSEVDRRAAQLRELAGTLGRELHALAVRVRPKVLDDFGLIAALTSFAEEWTRQHGIVAEVHAGADLERLPPSVESALYRIVQEALTNVAKHSDATHTSVVVERSGGSVHVIVEDDGKGFDADVVADAGKRPAALGLLGIRERAALLGGSLQVETAPGAGTTIFVRLPIHTTDAQRHAAGSGDDDA